jgi:hypothetical protein
MTQDVRALASEECAGRLTGTNGEYAAAAYIVREFERAGWSIERQQFDVPNRPGARGFNLIARRGEGVERVLVVGAHYDHLGRGYPGADDNASGVAILLELARSMPATTSPVWLVAFSGEELGNLGSSAFVRAYGADVGFMINLDMVGRLRDGSLVVSGVGSGKGVRERLERIAGPFRVGFDAPGLGPSDHASFVAAGIPAIHVFTGSHDDYHRPSDTPERLNYSGMARIARWVRAVVVEFAREPFPEFGEARAQRTGFRVRLGTMPDYSDSGPGILLQAVASGGPAERAGLRRGDRILEIAGVPVDDIETYMDLLGELDPGKPVGLKYERDGCTETTTIVPEAP